MAEKRNYSGWRRDKLDNRDFLFRKYRLSTGDLPSNVDIRPIASPILDQGELGSCTSFALCALCECLQNKDAVPFEKLSELFLYYNERVIENSVKWDDGAEIRDGIKTLAKQGICTDESWPYIIKKFKNKPTTACYKEGLDHQIVSYYKLTTLTDFKQCLSDGFPFCGGISVYESFESDNVAETGIVPYPKRRENMLGGHAISVFGFSDENQWFICKNSWGPEWGDDGWFYLPYKYLTNQNMASDFWTIRTEQGY